MDLHAGNSRQHFYVAHGSLIICQYLTSISAPNFVIPTFVESEIGNLLDAKIVVVCSVHEEVYAFHASVAFFFVSVNA